MDRLALGSAEGWRALCQALVCSEEIAVRGWVVARLPELGAVRVRICALEVPTSGLRAGSGQPLPPQPADSQEPPWLMPPWAPEEGFFGTLRLSDIAGCVGCERQGRDGLLPVGALVHARILRSDAVDRSFLRSCDASCALSLLAVRAYTGRPLGVLAVPADAPPSPSEGGTATGAAAAAAGEWPRDGFARAVAMNPSAGNLCSLVTRALQVGVLSSHGTLFAENRSRIEPSRGLLLSGVQSKNWADRRVREGVSLARGGDQKGALERYNVALELCPQHKEGLVGRGAALVNLGRAREGLNDFEGALQLDSEDTNALKYREIARRRLGSEAARSATSPGSAAALPPAKRSRRGDVSALGAAR